MRTLNVKKVIRPETLKVSCQGIRSEMCDVKKIERMALLSSRCRFCLVGYSSVVLCISQGLIWDQPLLLLPATSSLKEWPQFSEVGSLPHTNHSVSGPRILCIKPSSFQVPVLSITGLRWKLWSVISLILSFDRADASLGSRISQICDLRALELTILEGWKTPYLGETPGVLKRRVISTEGV